MQKKLLVSALLSMLVCGVAVAQTEAAPEAAEVPAAAAGESDSAAAGASEPKQIRIPISATVASALTIVHRDTKLPLSDGEPHKIEHDVEADKFVAKEIPLSIKANDPTQPVQLTLEQDVTLQSEDYIVPMKVSFNDAALNTAQPVTVKSDQFDDSKLVVEQDDAHTDPLKTGEYAGEIQLSITQAV